MKNAKFITELILLTFFVYLVYIVMMFFSTETKAALNYRVTCYAGEKIIYKARADFETYKEHYFKFNDGKSIFITNATCTIQL